MPSHVALRPRMTFCPGRIAFKILITVAILTTATLAQEGAEPGSQGQAPAHPTELLPDSVAIYAEAVSFETLWKHPLRERLSATDLFQEIWNNPDLAQAKNGLQIAEITLGKKLPLLLSEISASGITIAVDRATNGLALIIAGKDEATQQEIVNELVNKAAQLQGREDGTLPSADYRGVKAYRLPEGGFALLGKYLVVVNKGDLGKAIIDRFLDGPRQSLSQKESFISHKTKQELAGDKLLWFYADVHDLREAGVAKELLQQKPDDFGAELLFGGLFTILRNTPEASGYLQANASSIKLAINTPFDKAWLTEGEDFFFGPEVSGNAEPPLSLPNELASLTTYRNISQLWLHAGDLFGEKVNDQLAQAESTLTTLFSGKDFGEEILGAFQPEIRLIALPPHFEDGAPIPAVKIPAFAIVGKLKEPKTMRRELKRIYQSFIGFINIAGAMNGQPQFDQEMDKIDDADLLIAKYVWDETQPASKEVPIAYNFTPSLVLVGDYMILSSTEHLARQIHGYLTKPQSEQTPPKTESSNKTLNTSVVVSAAAVRESLETNRSQIITNNMLQKGQSREEAEAEFNIGMRILELASKLAATFQVGDTAELEFTLDLVAP